MVSDGIIFVLCLSATIHSRLYLQPNFMKCIIVVYRMMSLSGEVFIAYIIHGSISKLDPLLSNQLSWIHGLWMMTSSNGNIFRVTVLAQRPVTRRFDGFFDVRFSHCECTGCTVYCLSFYFRSCVLSRHQFIRYYIHVAMAIYWTELTWPQFHLLFCPEPYDTVLTLLNSWLKLLLS